MPPIELAERLALLLALAIFLGLAFEGIYKRDEPTIPGGIRMFPLVGLAGTMLYLIEPQRAFAFIAGLFAMGAWLYAFSPVRAPARHRVRQDVGDPDVEISQLDSRQAHQFSN